MVINRVVQWDIHARNAVAQRRFYADVFGWQCSHPDTPGEYGWMSTPEGAMLGGIGQAGDGETPGVAIFVQVNDVSGTIERATRLGGRRLWGPREFEGMAIACIADPAGNGLLLIRPAETGEPYASCPPADPEQWRWEIQSSDPAALAPFYEALFGWTFDGLNEWGWGALRTGDGGGPDGALAAGEKSCVFVYATVADLPATLARIDARGGRTLIEPWQVTDDLAVAVFIDPEGNRAGLRCLAPVQAATAG